MYNFSKLGILLLLLIYPSSSYTLFKKTPLLFLQSNQISSSDSSQELTSLGTLASGLESADSDVHDLADGLDTSLKQLSDQLDSSISITAQSSVAILNSEIQNKYHELDKTNKLINKLEGELVNSSGVCGDFVTCDDCTINSHCIWCSSNKQCMTGDESGPFKGECSQYEYNTCMIEGCEQHKDCSTCISYSECGWCSQGNYCFSGSPSNTKECSAEYFYHEDGTHNTCSEEKKSEAKNSAVDAYINYNPTASYDLDTKEKEEALQDLREYATELEVEIETLEVQKQQILTDAEKGMDIEINNIDLGTDLEGLTENVDSIYRQERQDDRDYVQQLASNSTERIISETNAKIDNSTNTIVEKQDASTEQILKTMAEYSKKAEQDLQTAKAEAKAQRAEEQAAKAQAEAEARAQAQAEAQAKAEAEAQAQANSSTTEGDTEEESSSDSSATVALELISVSKSFLMR
jgi:hypothetical protein